jgi:hypothetical protein
VPGSLLELYSAALPHPVLLEEEYLQSTALQNAIVHGTPHTTKFALKYYKCNLAHASLGMELPFKSSTTITHLKLEVDHNLPKELN